MPHFYPFLALSPPDLFSAPSGGIPLTVNVNDSEEVGSVVGVGIEEEEEEEDTDGVMHDDVVEGPSHNQPNFVLVEPVQHIQLNQMKK